MEESKASTVRFTKTQLRSIQTVIQRSMEKGLGVYSMDYAKDLIEVYHLIDKTLGKSSVWDKK